MITGTYIGRVDSERSVILGTIPVEAPSGWIMRAITVLVSEAVAADPEDYWILQVGIYQQSGFHVLHEFPLQNGLAARPVRLALTGRPRLAQGDLIAARFVLRGLASSLEGLSLVPEYGIFGSRRN